MIFGSNPKLADTDGDGLQDDGDRDPLTDVELKILESAPPELDSENIQNAVNVWPELIENAAQSIYLETYYLSDSVPSKIYGAMENAAERGVEVKILLDEDMYEEDPTQADRLGSVKNIEVRTLPVGEMSGGWLHSKYFIIDSRETFVGSQNWSWNALKNSREIGVLVRSKALSEAVISIFKTDWKKSGGEPLTPQRSNDADNDGLPREYETWLGTNPDSADTDNDGAPDLGDPNPFVPLDIATKGLSVGQLYPVETAPITELDNPHIQNTENGLLELIGSASETVRAQLYQYTTAGGYTALDNALRKVAGRGIQVEVLVDNKSYLKGRHPHPETLDNLSAVENLAVKIIDIEDIGLWTNGGWIHTKILFVDGKLAYVGSANWFAPHMGHEITLGGWNPGPTRDVGVIFRSPETVNVLENIFVRDWKSGYTALL